MMAIRFSRRSGADAIRRAFASLLAALRVAESALAFLLPETRTRATSYALTEVRAAIARAEGVRVKTPVAWQQFGSRWCLTGQHGMRPIYLSVSPKGELMLRDEASDRLVPFSPEHTDARQIVDSINEEPRQRALAHDMAQAVVNLGSTANAGQSIHASTRRRCRACAARLGDGESHQRNRQERDGLDLRRGIRAQDDRESSR